MEYNADDLNKIFKAVVVIVKKGDSVLIIRRKDWKLERPNQSDICFPGGKQNSNERADIAAARELREETGIKVPSKNLVLIGGRDHPRANGKIAYFSVDFYKCSGNAICNEPEKHSYVGFDRSINVINEIGEKSLFLPIRQYLLK